MGKKLENRSLAPTTSTQLKIGGTATAPASATAPGKAGDVVFAPAGIYLCTATNVWVRAALATF